MHNGACTLCLAINTRVINIINTYLQPVYEKLADLQIDNVSCWMCFICHRRLQQCYQLWKLAEHTRSVMTWSILGVEEVTKEDVFGTKNSLLELSVSKQINIIIPPTEACQEVEVNVKSEPFRNVVGAQRADSDDSRARRDGSDEQSSKLSSYYENEDSIEDINDVLETNVDQRLDVQIECEDIKEEYVQEKMTVDTGDEEAVTGWSFGAEEDEQDLTSSEGFLRNSNVLKLEIEKFSASVISEHIYGSSAVGSTYGNPRARDSVGTVCELDPTSNKQNGISLETHSVPTSNTPIIAQACHDREGDKLFILTQESSVQRHIKTFSCDICLRMFSQKSSLEKHFKIHKGNRPFSCGICHRKYSLKGRLEKHLKIHSGEKPFSCDICQRNFLLKEHLQSHLKIHTGEKPFSCHICKRKFSLNRNLLRHIGIHKGDKPFSCDICQQKFSQMVHLNSHLKIHTDDKHFRCEICQREFSVRKNLLRHLKTHSDDKPYGCSICQRTFSRNNSLKIHLKIHSGEKPFGCHICQRKFSLKRYLQIHLKIHT